MINALLKDIHRLRKLIRDANAEVEKAPKVHKAHQTKVAALQKAVADAKDELKTTDIARNARAFTFLISCKAKAKEKETARN